MYLTETIYFYCVLCFQFLTHNGFLLGGKCKFPNAKRSRSQNTTSCNDFYRFTFRLCLYDSLACVLSCFKYQTNVRLSVFPSEKGSGFLAGQTDVNTLEFLGCLTLRSRKYSVERSLYSCESFAIVIFDLNRPVQTTVLSMISSYTTSLR